MEQSTNSNQFAELGHRAGMDDFESDELAGTGDDLPEDLLELAVGAMKPNYPSYCTHGEEWFVCDIVF